MAERLDSYTALALQTPCRAVNRCADRAEAAERMAATIDDLAVKIRAAKAFLGQDVKLVVLPEYFLTSFPTGESIPAWRDKAALEPDGPEYAALGRIAADNNLYLAGNAYERDGNFPQLYFQTSFVIAPSGETILRYRRLNSMYAPTPHDVWDRYLELYGLDGVFPVADTPIGRLACIASEEILYPEIARCLALRGAEIFCHSSSEVGSPRPTPKSVAKQARAIENMAVVISANSAGIFDSGFPANSTDGGSIVIDHRGLALAEAGPGDSVVANAQIDLTALRRARRRPGMGNLLARQRLELFAAAYAGTVQPANSLIENGTVKTPDRRHFTETQAQVIERLARAGRI